MTNTTQDQTQGATSAQQNSAATEDHPANVVKYSYPDGSTGFTDVVEQDTQDGELPSEGFDISKDSAPLTQLHRNESTVSPEIAEKLNALGNSDGTTHTYIPPQTTESPGSFNVSDTGSVGAPNDGLPAVDSGNGATTEASTDHLGNLPSELSAYDESQVNVKPLTDTDLADGTDGSPLAADGQVSGDDSPKSKQSASKKAVI